MMTEGLDIKDQIDELAKSLGDCDIHTILAKRKNEVMLFTNRLQRNLKEYENMKKESNNDTDQKVKEIGFKLKASDKERIAHLQCLSEDLEKLKPQDFTDFKKNHLVIKKLREFKQRIKQSEIKLKDIEDIQKEVVRSLTEQNMESSINILTAKAVDLKEQLLAAKKQLKCISKTAEEMDGNTSNNEEEEFIFALKDEMP